MSKQDFLNEMQEIFEGYSENIQECINSSLDEVRKTTVKRLKETSPVGKNKKYAKSWVSSIQRGRLVSSIVIYNKEYRLTHLLENGHMEFNQHGGAYGRARAFPHIKPAQEEASKEVVELISEKIKNI